jgi:hypothetical protein
MPVANMAVFRNLNRPTIRSIWEKTPRINLYGGRLTMSADDLRGVDIT